PIKAATRGGCVDADTGDVMGDPVMEFAGDADAFEVEGLTSQALLLFADLGIGLLQLRQQAPLRECPVAEEPGPAEEDGIDEEGDSGGGRELDEGHLTQIPELEGGRDDDIDEDGQAQQAPGVERDPIAAPERTDRVDGGEEDDLRDTGLHHLEDLCGDIERG